MKNAMRAASSVASAPQAPRAQAAVIGAGVVGLAVARALAKRGVETLILESEDTFGTGTTSRNSEVIHAGIYYAAGSLKARSCVAGRRLLYDFCKSHGVAHKRCGKLLVATRDEELPMLSAIARQAHENGLAAADEALRQLTPAEAVQIEPNVRCVGALLSPSTGIVDSHALSLALLGSAQSHGTELVSHTSVLGGRVRREGSSDTLLLCTSGGDLECDIVVNAAGHGAPAIARALDGMPQQLVPTPYYAKGNYFQLVGPSPFRGLVYPLPQQAGLGVHATVDLGGRCRFGPDVEWTTRHDDYDVDASRAEAFYAAVREYWPELPDGALVADYAGVRPKLQGPGESSHDFCLQGPADHGVKGLVNLFGIESPGLTASLALAEACVDMCVEGGL